MAWFLVGAAVVIVVAISAAVIAWALVMWAGIRMFERQSGSGEMSDQPEYVDRSERPLRNRGRSQLGRKSRGEDARWLP
ncbi:MAG: hypothetical protein ABW065_07355 [Solirubrobacterales bacterium]